VDCVKFLHFFQVGAILLTKSIITRLVVLESGLGLESGLKSIFAGLGLGLGLGLESYGLGLGLGLGGSASKSFFKSFVLSRSIALTDYFAVAL